MGGGPWMRLHEPPPRAYPGISPEQQLPGDLESTPGIPHAFSPRPAGSLKTPPLGLRGEKRRPCHPLKGPRSQELTELSCSHPEVSPLPPVGYSNCGGAISNTGHDKFKGNPSYIRAHTLLMPPV